MKKIITHRKITKNIVTIDHLVAFLGIDKNVFQKTLEIAPQLYRQISRLKKDGGVRVINAPKPSLKLIQRIILDKIFSDTKLPRCVYGLSKNYTIIENAKKHSNGDYLLNLDIKNFFPSVHYTKVKKIYEDIGLTKISDTLCILTTHKYELPQGAPTSPFLASFALTNLDYRLTTLAKVNHLTYTRYFDDISFSGSKRVKQLEKNIVKIIEQEGYETKSSKRKLFEKGEVKEINGILVFNKKLSLKSTKNLIKYLNELKTNGLSMLKNDNPEKERCSLVGKIAFLKQVDPKEGDKQKKVFDAIKW